MKNSDMRLRTGCAGRFLFILVFLSAVLMAASSVQAEEACTHEQWSEWTVKWEPDCANKGTEMRYCLKCEIEEERELPPTGEHEWGGGWYLVKAVTCGEAGKETRTCNVCDKTESRIIPATGKHKYGAWQVQKAPTLKKTGVKVRWCKGCGKKQTGVLPIAKPYAKFTKKTYTVKVGKKLKLFPKVQVAGGDVIKKWSSSKPAVATVNYKGVVTAKKAGMTKITYWTKTGKKATCKVKVTAKKK